MQLLDNPIHLMFVLVLALLVFGAKRLPEMGRSLGSGMRGFRDALAGESATRTHAAELTPAPVVSQALAPAPAPAPATANVAAAVSTESVESVTHAA